LKQSIFRNRQNRERRKKAEGEKLSLKEKMAAAKQKIKDEIAAAEGGLPASINPN